MQNNIDEFKRRNIFIKVISFAELKELQIYQEHFQWKMELYSDPKRTFYKFMGLTRGSWFKVFHPKTAFKYVQYFLEGKKMKKTRQDIYQMGGDFIFNKNGELKYVFKSQRPDDRPSVSELINQIKNLKA